MFWITLLAIFALIALLVCTNLGSLDTGFRPQSSSAQQSKLVERYNDPVALPFEKSGKHLKSILKKPEYGQNQVNKVKFKKVRFGSVTYYE